MKKGFSCDTFRGCVLSNEFVDALKSLSGKLIPEEPSRRIPFPSMGGTRK